MNKFLRNFDELKEIYHELSDLKYIKDSYNTCLRIIQYHEAVIDIIQNYMNEIFFEKYKDLENIYFLKNIKNLSYIGLNYFCDCLTGILKESELIIESFLKKTKFFQKELKKLQIIVILN